MIRVRLNSQRWHLSNRADKRALPLADRHYNRQKIGSPQFVPPGRCAVFLTEQADALWVTSWPKGEYVQHAWPGAWINSLFRNESNHVASELIVEAIAATMAVFGKPPKNGLVTFVDEDEIKPTRTPGYCYRKAGFEEVGRTQAGLVVLQLAPSRMPMALAALPANETEAA